MVKMYEYEYEYDYGTCESQRHQWSNNKNKNILAWFLLTLTFAIVWIAIYITCCYFGFGYEYEYDVLSDEAFKSLLNMKGLRVDTCQLYVEILQIMFIKYYHDDTPLSVVEFTQRIYDVCIKKSN